MSSVALPSFRQEPVSGTFCLVAGPFTSSPLPYNATAEEIQAALDALRERVDGDIWPSDPEAA